MQTTPQSASQPSLESTLEANKALVRRMVETIQNQHRLECLEDFFAPDFFNHLDHAPESPLNSVDKARQVFGPLFAAFPDLQVTILSQLAEDDRVVTHKRFEGTHQGDFMGVSPTGKRIGFEVIDMLRIDEGKIIEHWAVQDRLSLLSGLGLA